MAKEEMTNKDAIKRLKEPPEIVIQGEYAMMSWDREAIGHAIAVMERVERLIELTGKEDGYYRPTVGEILGILICGERLP